MWLHGRRAVSGMVPRYRARSMPKWTNASSHTGRRSWSSHESKRAPFFQARSITSARGRSPRAKMPSSTEALASWVLSLTAFWPRAPSRRICCLRATSESPSIAAHWKGVCGLGTWVETLTTTSTALPRAARLPAATVRMPVSTTPRTSSSVSVGRPIMK